MQRREPIFYGPTMPQPQPQPPVTPPTPLTRWPGRSI